MLPSSTSDSEGNFLFSDSSDDDDNDALPPPPTSDHHHYHHEQQLHSKTANNSRSKAMKTPRNAVVVPTATALNNHAGNTLSTTTVCKPLKKSSGRKSQKAPRSSSSSAAAAAPVAASRKKKSDNTINIVTPVVHLIPTPSTMQENEDEDDICPVCDGDCTCQSAAPSINTTSIINTTAITLPPTPIVISSSSMNQNAAKRNSVTSSAKQITLKAQPVTSTISSQSKTAAAASTTTSKAKGSSRATKSGTTSNRNTSKTKSKSKLKAAAVSEAVTAAAIATKEANSATAAAVAAATAAQEEVDAQIAVAMSLDIIKNENEKRHVAVPSKHGNRDDGWIVKDVDKNNNNKEDKMDLDFMSALDAAFSGLISEDEENETSNSKPSSSSTFKNTSSTAASNITTATNINGNDESRRGYGISSSAFGDIHGLGLGIDETTGDHYLVQLVNENDFMQLVKDEGDDQDSLFSSDEDLLLFYPDDEEGDDDEENHQDNNMMDEDEIVGQFMMAGGCGWSSDEEEDYKIYRLFQADENDDHVLFLADESPEDDEDNNSVLSNESYTADVGLESQSSLLHSSSIAGGSANNQLGPNTIPDVVVHPPIIEPPPEPLPPPSLSYDIKKTQVGPNGELITTTKTIAFKMTPKTLSSSNKKGKKGSAKAAAANTTFDVGSSSCKPSGAGPSQVGGVISHQQPLSAVSLPIPSQLHLQQQTPTLFPMLGTQPLNPFLSNPASAAALQAAAASILKNYGHPAATGSATSSTSAYASLAAINPFAAAAAMVIVFGVSYVMPLCLNNPQLLDCRI